MTQNELDDKISLLRTEKFVLLKSIKKTEELSKVLKIEKRIVHINKEMKDLRKRFRKERRND